MTNLTNQAHLFDLPKEVHYLNVAYMSPLLKQVAQKGHEMVDFKLRPYEIQPQDFFTTVEKTKAAFAKIINTQQKERVAIIPSVSYGMANVANNIDLQSGDQIIVTADQFPSNYYPWQQLAREKNGQIVTINCASENNRTLSWNQAILEAINPKTKVVAISHTHWTDGTVFNLEAISKRCKEVDALLIIDGTQSIGALPFDQQKIKADAIVCAGYKWLLGPYSSGVAYYGDYFDNGSPIENNWINKHNSEDFQNLVNYQDNYKPFAARYSVGEQSNFILTEMLLTSLNQLLDWGIPEIQHYCQTITQNSLNRLTDFGVKIESPELRAHHLFGLYLNKNIDVDQLKKEFSNHKVYVSFRGNAIRVAPHVYNTEKDLEALVHCFEKLR